MKKIKITCTSFHLYILKKIVRISKNVLFRIYKISSNLKITNWSFRPFRLGSVKKSDLCLGDLVIYEERSPNNIILYKVGQKSLPTKI